MQIVTSTTPNGILVRSASVPGRCFGALTFGVGTRDEPVALAGITHLVLHLIEAGVGPRTVPQRVVQTSGSTTFEVSGSLTQVLAHFRAVAAAIRTLGDVSKSELERQKRLLHIEEPSDYLWGGSDLATVRYGLDDLGLAGFGHPGVDAFTKKDVAGWAAEWFTAANAAVALTKPLAASFDLDVPAGSIPIRRPARAVAVTPALVPMRFSGASLTLAVEAPGAAQVGEAVQFALRKRLTDEAGLVYSVGFTTTRVDEVTSEWAFDLDPLRVDLPETIRAAVLALRDIADEGVADGELGLAAEYERLASAGDPATVRDRLIESNELALRGLTPPAIGQSLAFADALTAADVAGVVSRALPTLIVGFHEGTSPDHAESMKKVSKGLGVPIEVFEAWTPVADKVWKKAAKDARVWVAKKRGDVPGESALVTPDALFFSTDGTHGARLRFDDLALVGERPSGDLVLVTKRGPGTPVDAADWKQGKQFVKALRKAVPAELVREFPAV